MQSEPWRDRILKQLQSRNQKQRQSFESLIKFNNRIADEIHVLRAKNLQLQVDVEKLQKENVELAQNSSNGKPGSSKATAVLEQRCAQLEQRHMKHLEELTELHKQKGEKAQLIIDLTAKVQEKDQEITSKNAKIDQLEGLVEQLKKENVCLGKEVESLKSTNVTLLDEQQALHMSFIHLEQKFHTLEKEHNELVARWMQDKSKQADWLNEENEKFVKKKQEKIVQDLKEAAQETKEVVEPEVEVHTPAVAYVVTVPSRALSTIEAHEGDVYAVKWSCSGKYFATGGADRKAKIWEVVNGRMSHKSSLIGSNGAVLSVEFDYQDQQLLAGCADFAVRMWTIADQRLRITLTGHNHKVIGAKYFKNLNKVLSGSYDRTLKLWDVRKNQCERTLFAGSCCYDFVLSDSFASNVMSGHFDRKVRFWDIRADHGQETNDIQLPGKVSSLDLSPDGQSLLCCTRNDSIHIIDLRMNQVIKNLTADGFRAGYECSRAVFSPDGQYVVCGGSDTVYVWNVYKSSLEKTLKEHTGVITAASWDPKGSAILSCDRNKTVVYWSDF